MAKELSYQPLTDIGLNGLNTQSNPASLDTSFLVKAENVVIRESGRIAFRKGLKQKVAPSGTAIASVVEHNDVGTNKIFVSYGTSIYAVDFTSPASAFPSSGADVKHTVANSTGDWQFVNFNDRLHCFHAGVEPQRYDGSLTSGSRWTAHATKPASVSSNQFKPTCGMGLYGRIWAGGVAESPDVVYYGQIEDIEVIAQQECSLYLSNNKNVIAPTVYFQDYFEIISGGKKIDLYYFGPSHGECMIVIHLVEENLLFIPDLLHTKGASFPTDATLPYLRPSTLINFFNELEKLAQKKKIKSFIGGYTEDKLIGSTSIIAEQRIFWELMQTTAEQAEVDGIINLDNFIDLEKLDLEPYQQYDNFNKDDLINIIRRYTSFQNMGR